MNFAGRTILVTRPEPECQETGQAIWQAGGNPLLAPALVIAPPVDEEPLRQALAHVSDYRGVILTSANGARVFVDRVGAREVPPLYAVGPKTALVLQQAGFAPRMPAVPTDSASLAAMLDGGAGRPYLFLRAEEGREELPEQMAARGCPVDLVTAYRAVPAQGLPGPVRQAWQQGRVDAVTFFSRRTATVFLSLWQDCPELADTPWPLLAANSYQTAEPLLARGLSVDVIASVPTAAALLAALSDLICRKSEPLPACPA